MEQQGSEKVLDYIASRFDKFESKFDDYVKDDRSWKDDHAKEDRDNFQILKGRLDTADTTQTTTNTLNAVTKDNKRTYLAAAGIIAGILLNVAIAYGTVKVALHDTAQAAQITQTNHK